MMDVDRVRDRLIVSCQAPPGSPLRDPAAMALMARAAVAGGAGGIRACGAADIAAIRAQVDVPIIGITKRAIPGSDVLITPSFEDAVEVVEAGADIVALDATGRPRADGSTAATLIARVVRELGVAVMADVDSVLAGRHAASAGASLVATTLAGYTHGAVPASPDIALVRRLVAAVEVPVVAEGRYATVSQVAAAFRAGAFAVVIGTAITDPMTLTRRLSTAVPVR
jgi:N-acylglucosamine-6-phosphate 2-epimerase